MARQLRIEYPGALYHVISRGENREIIFQNDFDKDTFLRKTEEAVIKYCLKIHSFVLMNNHYHFLIETPLGSISKPMHLINTSYTNWYKAKYQKIGSVFHGRFRSILVEKKIYMLNVSTYIHFNPIRAKIVLKPEAYIWSSFSNYVNNTSSFPWIFCDDILNMFSGDTEAYKSFVYRKMERGKEIKKEEIFGKNSILGGATFRESVRKRIDTSQLIKDIREKPDLKHIQAQNLTFSDIKEIILATFQIDEQILLEKKRNNVYRKLFLFGLRKYTDLSLKEIGMKVGMDYCAVFQSTNRFLLASKNNQEQKIILDKFEGKVLILMSNVKTRPLLSFVLS